MASLSTMETGSARLGSLGLWFPFGVGSEGVDGRSPMIPTFRINDLGFDSLQIKIFNGGCSREKGVGDVRVVWWESGEDEGGEVTIGELELVEGTLGAKSNEFLEWLIKGPIVLQSDVEEGREVSKSRDSVLLLIL